MAAEAPVPLLEMRGVTKHFGSTRALDHVDISVLPAEIHALVGENGAGKSTLIKILAGLFPPDGGEIRFKGTVSHPHSERLPISFVHQDIGLVDELSVGENVAMVAGFPRRAGLINWPLVWSQARHLYDAFNIDPPDPRADVGLLDAASKAVLGIVRALAHRATLLVLDEPTAALPESDAQRLFGVLRKLRAGGTGIIYVSHRLSELFGLVDRITVLRDGRRVRTSPVGALTPESLVTDMLGHAVDFSHTTQTKPTHQPTVEVTDLQTEVQGPISFVVDAGEIVGLVGLRGAGQEVIGRAIFGAAPIRSGHIRLGGEEVPQNSGTARRIAAGMALLAGDRARESAFSGMSIRENLFPHPGIIRASAWTLFAVAAERKRTRTVLQRFDVRPADGEVIIDWLSGGNQQKVFVARWLVSDARLLILEEPTAGVDIGAKVAIHGMVRDTAAGGAALLVVSSDFEEVCALCDRALVLYGGQIVEELHGAALTVANLLACSSLGAAAPACQD
ncbi:MAG: sugar ABC transporter ATP-binding protein [Acetobacteraceae bacterium]